MYAITGITGQVGGAMAQALLDAGLPVRAVVRNAEKGAAWAAKGCDVAIATMEDADALAKAFMGAEGVFILPPNAFDPSPGFPEARAVISAVMQALNAARPARVVCLSTIGAQARQPNLLTQRTLMEEALSALPMPVTFLRPAWFMENFAWDIAAAIDTGVFKSFLQPLDKPVAMIATVDIGRLAAKLIQEHWEGRRIVELEAERRYSPNDVAAAFASILGRPVLAESVPRETWGPLFKSQGMKDPIPRMQMLDGFNEGWIQFEGESLSIEKGPTALSSVLAGLTSAVG
ncbi:NmrA family NAD(P)-binding protein [Hyphomicrobium sp. 802]|uniref:NmrA family NAD(P)-binding protein n=1 Tax=Hyphomicrobium sp. 802 TaxID=1112272 RepID=UPI00045E9F78|nr:NmrA family NAD(P)-binding protein [Hyphomicrobium sp. 802]